MNYDLIRVACAQFCYKCGRCFALVRRACAGCVDAPDRKSVYLSSWRTYASGGERAQRKSVPEQLLRRETGALLYKLDAKVTRPKCGLAACKTLAKTYPSLAATQP